MQLKRDHIGIFGKMNAGKSTIMNLLAQQKASIVDDTPGTTTDTKTILMELHGLGPVRIYDTPGLDEAGILGEKKRKKAYMDLKEIDVALLIIDPRTKDLDVENQFISASRKLDKQILIIYNIFTQEDKTYIPTIERQLCDHKYYPKLPVQATDNKQRSHLLDYIITQYQSSNENVSLIPFVKPDRFYILNIPMDEETPEGRLLRPQQLCVEYLTRNDSYPICYRMDLSKARSDDHTTSEEEHKRYLNFIQHIDRPACVITDSQAMDIIPIWTPEHIDITTFSITMIHYLSMGRLDKFINGVSTIKNLDAHSRVLIVESCNHSRICDDIGTKQIPRKLKELQPDLIIEFNFGREFIENDRLENYDLVIHCGACMSTPQQLSARLRDLDTLEVAYTNYGILLSYLEGPEILKRALEPWSLDDKLRI